MARVYVIIRPKHSQPAHVRLRLLLLNSPLFALLRELGSAQPEETLLQPALPQCPSLSKQPPTSSTFAPRSTHQIPPLSQQFVRLEAPDPSANLRQDLPQPQSHSETALGSHMEKVLAIDGDMVQPNFGLSPQDQQRLASEVNIVIHAAASISFDDHIHAALAHNYQVNVFPLPMVMAFALSAQAALSCSRPTPSKQHNIRCLADTAAALLTCESQQGHMQRHLG